MSVENPEGELTREEFALFMYNHLNDQVDGKSLYERAGFVPGPTGEIEKVNAGEKTPILQIAGKEYTLSEHPRILHASADPATWQGKRVEESWAVAVDGTLHLIVFDAAASSATDAAVPTSAASQAAGSHTGAGHEHHEHEEEGSSFPVVPVVLAVILLSIVGTFWVSRKKSN